MKAMPDWSAVRDAMLLDPTQAYLNTGSYGITPKCVFDEVTVLRRRMQQNPTDFLWRTINEPLWRARSSLADYLHVDPKQLILTVNVSIGINLAAWSLALATPGEVVLTDHEYGAMRYAWERATIRQGLTLRTIPLPFKAQEPGQVVEAIVRELRPETRLLFLSHVYYTTGMVLPLKEICQEARKRGVLTMIDGAHAPGMLPLNLMDLGADFYSANLHKWFLAPVGTGFLHVRPGLEDRLVPMHVSWGWHYDRTASHERDIFGGTPWLRSHEFEGSRDPCPWLVLPTVVQFHEQLGLAQVRQRHRWLSDRVRQQLDGLAGLRLASPQHDELRGGLTSFCFPKGWSGPDAQAFRQRLWERHRFEINCVENPDGPFLRVSTHFYNTEAEIDRLASVLPDTLRG